MIRLSKHDYYWTLDVYFPKAITGRSKCYHFSKRQLMTFAFLPSSTGYIRIASRKSSSIKLNNFRQGLFQTPSNHPHNVWARKAADVPTLLQTQATVCGVVIEPLMHSIGPDLLRIFKDQFLYVVSFHFNECLEITMLDALIQRQLYY